MILFQKMIPKRRLLFATSFLLLFNVFLYAFIYIWSKHIGNNLRQVERSEGRVKRDKQFPIAGKSIYLHFSHLICFFTVLYLISSMFKTHQILCIKKLHSLNVSKMNDITSRNICNLGKDIYR